LYGLLAATAYAVFIIVNGRVGNDYPPVHKSALMVSGAGLLIFTVLQPFHLLTFEVDVRIYQFGLLLSAFGTVLLHFYMHTECPKWELPWAAFSVLSNCPWR